MNLLADESIDKSIVDRLRNDGHAVLHQANQSGSLLMTSDKDFGELVFRMGQVHAGVVLLRLAGLSSLEKTLAVSSVFANRGNELLEAFSVISPGRVRIRRLAAVPDQHL